jgi:hypothetical protein
VVFIAVHTDMDRETALDYINEHYPDSEMKFVFDNEDEGYFLNLGGTDYYPRTLVLDADGVITMTYDGKLSKEQLVSKIQEAMKN